jgi:biopolymer transport protein ExbB/TolQ
VSVGVLGTFVGIFIGLQAFNPNDIVHSVNDILLGLKTAFFTSIVGMSVSTGLSILQKFQNESKN